VLFTASDAFLRDYHTFVPEDCTVSIEAEDNVYALRQMRDLLAADTTPSTELDLERLRRGQLQTEPSTALRATAS
jgi:nicotinamidase-related amidase